MSKTSAEKASVASTASNPEDAASRGLKPVHPGEEGKTAEHAPLERAAATRAAARRASLAEEATGNDDAPGPGDAITDRDLDRIAEVITGPQIDRLVRLRARLEKRDENVRLGIRPTTHIIMRSAVKVRLDGRPQEIDAGRAVLIAALEPGVAEQLLRDDLAESPV